LCLAGQLLAGALLVLVDGAASTSQIDVHMAPALHARWAEQLLDASLPAARPSARRRRQRTRSRGAAL
jgi:hypothetical protein